MVLNVLKVFGLSTLSFIIGMLLTPLLTHYLYKYKMWRTEARTHAAPDGSATPIFRELHKERETRVPRMGGILIWFVPLLVTLLFWMLSFTDRVLFQKLNFLSRSQTWLPLFTLVAASLVGVADDLRTVYWKSKNAAGGIRFSRRLIMIFLIALVGAWWFYFKLDASHVNIPFYGDFEIGFLFPIFFIFVMLATFSGSVIDGIDGLAGGVMAMIFTAYAGIAFLTNAVLVLPIIALPLVLDAGSVIIQLFSKKFLKRKIFLVAPLHHHFEAMGWPPYKVTMRAWVLTYVAALVGVIIQLLG